MPTVSYWIYLLLSNGDYLEIRQVIPEIESQYTTRENAEQVIAQNVELFETLKLRGRKRKKVTIEEVIVIREVQDAYGFDQDTVATYPVYQLKYYKDVLVKRGEEYDDPLYDW